MYANIIIYLNDNGHEMKMWTLTDFFFLSFK